MNRQNRFFDRGFTLLELLVTISIIGIILGIISVSFSTAQKRSRDAKRKGDLIAIQKSLEQCYSLSSSYPAGVVSGASISCQDQTTMNMVPFDPKNSGAYGYTYSLSAGADTYCLCALLENVEDGNAVTAGSNGICSYGASSSYQCVSNQQ